MQVAFVNTDQPPIEVIHHRIWRHTHCLCRTTAQELVTKIYPHPDDPEVGCLRLLTWDDCIEISEVGAAHNLFTVEEHLLVGLNEAMAEYQNP